MKNTQARTNHGDMTILIGMTGIEMKDIGIEIGPDMATETTEIAAGIPDPGLTRLADAIDITGTNHPKALNLSTQNLGQSSLNNHRFLILMRPSSAILATNNQNKKK